MSENYFAMGVMQGDDGWAAQPFRGDKVHFYEREPMPQLISELHPELTGMYWSLCGMRAYGSDRLPMLAPGNFPHCKLCERSLAKKVP